MDKIAVVYWSGTGNTQAMADAVLDGIREKGGEGVLFTSGEFDPALLPTFAAFAFGCPSMGAEQLEEAEFEPMFSACRDGLRGKRVALFGSYGWGDGEWMRTWEADCKDAGISLACDSVICNESPDGDAIAACKALGAALVD